MPERTALTAMGIESFTLIFGKDPAARTGKCRSSTVGPLCYVADTMYQVAFQKSGESSIRERTASPAVAVEHGCLFIEVARPVVEGEPAGSMSGCNRRRALVARRLCGQARPMPGEQRVTIRFFLERQSGVPPTKPLPRAIVLTQ